MRTLLFYCLLTLAPGLNALPTNLVIASGEIGGVYFQMAGEFCRLVNLQSHAVQCSVLPTDGSQENLALLADGGADMALVQGDLLLAAYRGEGVFAGHPQADLRALMATHAEPLTLVVRKSWQGGLPALRGRPVSEKIQEVGFRIGAAILVLLMGIALFNDFARL